MNVLALASFPSDAAATRFRLDQLVVPLRDRGISLDVRPFLDAATFTSLYRRSAWPRTLAGLARGVVRRLDDIADSRDADVVLVQREAMLFGPPLIEWLATRVRGGRPLVLDLDDPTYIPYVSLTYGRLTEPLKWPSKTDTLIRWSTLVTCGSHAIADHVAAAGKPTALLPTVVDTDRFAPQPPSTEMAVPVLGWVGSHSARKYLLAIAPALQQLARRHRFHLRIVGSGAASFPITEASVELLPWSRDREVSDFQSFDIGLYPMVDDEWSRGKAGLKCIQYMAVGIPFVASPVGAPTLLGEPGVTHLLAHSDADWVEALSRLITDAELRRTMGAAGRTHVLARYTPGRVADTLAEALRWSVDQSQTLPSAAPT